MSNALPRRCEAVPITMADAPADGLPKSWNQIARVGEFRGHPQGAFAMDAKTWQVIKRNFDATENHRVPVDYEHFSETLGNNVAQKGAPALAWITEVEDRGEAGLFGLFEWVDPEAVEHVRAGRYRYVSPAIVFNAVDRETGEDIGARLTSVALTNHPFLDGMQPLAASDVATLQGALDKLTKQQTDLAAKLASLTADAVHIPAAIGAKPKDNKTMADAQEAQDNRIMSLMKRLRDALKMSDDADEEAMFSALAAKMSEHDKLCSERDERNKTAAAEAVKSRVDAGLIRKEGAVEALKLCLSDRALFDKLFPAPAQKAKDKPAESQGVQMSDDALALLLSGVSSESVRVQPGELVTAKADDHSEKAHERAQKLMSDHKGMSYATAIVEASRQIKTETVQSALKRLQGNH